MNSFICSCVYRVLHLHIQPSTSSECECLSFSDSKYYKSCFCLFNTLSMSFSLPPYSHHLMCVAAVHVPEL